MASKTLIGGTAYKLQGGKVLVNGVIYTILNGKTIVDKTIYEIDFGFVPFFEFGKITPSKGWVSYEYTTTIQAPKFDFSLCNAFLINGIYYDVIFDKNENGVTSFYDYNLTSPSFGVSESNPYRILFRHYINTDVWDVTFYSYNEGTYEVSLGFLS